MSETPSPSTPPESSQPNETVRIALTPAGGLGQVQVELEAFVAFNIWMTRELTELEDSFAHFQTSKSQINESSSRRVNRR